MVRGVTTWIVVLVTFGLASAVPGAEIEFTTKVVAQAGLWPQIQRTSTGDLLAFGYNSPAHTTLPGDIDCWASTDGGRTWSRRASAAPRPADHANYCHWSSGLAANGDLLVIASGLDHADNQGGRRTPNDVVVRRSSDAGVTWRTAGTFPRRIQNEIKPYPFGGVVLAPDGSLRTLAYSVYGGTPKVESVWQFMSKDDGQTWNVATKVADGINEAVLLPTGTREWLCVSRTAARPAPEYGQELRMFRSSDDGLTWTDAGLLAGYHQHPPHLLRLRDGRIVLTYCNRRDGGILVRMTSDAGQKWDEPVRLFQTGAGDRGYPSTVELPGGHCVTVFYAKESSLYSGYHMGAIGWKPPTANGQR